MNKADSPRTLNKILMNQVKPLEDWQGRKGGVLAQPDLAEGEVGEFQGAARLVFETFERSAIGCLKENNSVLLGLF